LAAIKFAGPEGKADLEAVGDALDHARLLRLI
jgi:hypothetical protein